MVEKLKIGNINLQNVENRKILKQLYGKIVIKKETAQDLIDSIKQTHILIKW